MKRRRERNGFGEENGERTRGELLIDFLFHFPLNFPRSLVYFYPISLHVFLFFIFTLVLLFSPLPSSSYPDLYNLLFSPYVEKVMFLPLLLPPFLIFIILSIILFLSSFTHSLQFPPFDFCCPANHSIFSFIFPIFPYLLSLLSTLTRFFALFFVHSPFYSFPIFSCSSTYFP